MGLIVMPREILLILALYVCTTTMRQRGTDGTRERSRTIERSIQPISLTDMCAISGR